MGKNSKKQFRRNERTYRGHHNLDKFLFEKKLERKPIAKDGSCLFRAVAEQVFSSQSCHHKVRMQCVEYIQTHQDDFKEFITVSIPEYLDHLRCELWGGEVELVVLSRLYDRSIIVYNEAAGLVHEQVFQSSEDQASSQNSPIMLAYSGGNHYDSVYSAQHVKNTAFCQGLVYETFFCRVLRDHMPPHCQQRLATLQEVDFEQLRKLNDPTSTERIIIRDRPTHLLSTHYTVEELESMASNMYRNTALDVHQREKANIERRDRRVAASIQFQRGDAVIFKIGDKEMEGEIAGLNVSKGCHLVYMLKSKEEWEIPAKDIALKQHSHVSSTSGKRTSSRTKSQQQQQQQQQPGSQTSSQKGQTSPTPGAASSGDSSKAQEGAAVMKEAQSSKKPSTQSGSSSSTVGVKSKEGKKDSTSQQGVPLVAAAPPTTTTGQLQKPSKVKVVPVSADQGPPPHSTSHTPTPDVKQPSTTPTAANTTTFISTGIVKNVAEPPAPSGPRRGGGVATRNVRAQVQVRSQQHGVKTIGPLAKVSKRTDAGSLDSDGPSSSSGDEDTPTHRVDTTQTRSAKSSNDLPAYYEDDGWRSGESKVKSQAQQQKQQQHLKERTNLPLVVGDGGKVGQHLGVYSDTTHVKQPVRAQKSVSTHTIKGSHVNEVAKVQPSKSIDASLKRQPNASTSTTAKPRDAVHTTNTSTSPVGKQTPQQQINVMQVPPNTGPLQQQSPIQGLIDGPNSEKSGRESPPYLERQIPRDPSSQPQDAWPMFEEDPSLPAVTAIPPATVVSSMLLNAASMAQRHQNQLQQQAPPPNAPPTIGGGVPPTTPTHNVKAIPVPSAPVTNLIPVCLLPSLASNNSILTTTPPVPSLPHAHQQKPPNQHQLQQKQQQDPTPPQSPHSAVAPDKLQGASGSAILSSVKQSPSPSPQGAKPSLPQQQRQQQPQPPPPLQSVLGFRQPAGAPTTTIPSVFTPLIHQTAGGHPQFMPSMTSAVMQHFYSRVGGIPTRPGGVELLYNQAQGSHSLNIQAPEFDNGGKQGHPAMARTTPLITPLQPLSTGSRKSPTDSYGSERAAMSPLLVTAYTQTTSPKVSSTQVQTETKVTISQGFQIGPTMKEAKTQTEYEFVAADDLQPPLLETDSKVAMVNFAIRYSIQCLTLYLQHCHDDETAAEMLTMMEAMEEERLKEPLMPYESQLTALNASQQDFLSSLTRDKTFPFAVPPLATQAHGGLGDALQQVSKEFVPPQISAEGGEDLTLQQAAASLPIIRKPPNAAPSDTTSEQPLGPSDDEKTSDLNVSVTPQQEVQAPAVPPFPLNPMMMHPQRPHGPYMFPMPVFYPPTTGFYPHSFPGMPGIPNMVMAPYGHHMIPSVMQQQQRQQQQQQQQGSQQEQTHVSPDDNDSAPTKLSPPPLAPSHHSPSSNPLPPSVSASSAGLESSSVDQQGAPVTGHVESYTAVQTVESTPEAYIQDKTSVAPLVAENTVVMPTVPNLTYPVLEEPLHNQTKGGSVKMDSIHMTDFPSATDITEHLEDYRLDDYQGLEVKAGSTSEPDVNISNPGLPCRGTSLNTKDVSFPEVKDDQKTAEPKQQRSKSLRSKQPTSQEGAQKQGRIPSAPHIRAAHQGSTQKTGTGSSGYNQSTKPSMYSQGDSRKPHNYRNQGQRHPHQYSGISGRKHHDYNNSRRSLGRHGQHLKWGSYHDHGGQQGTFTSFSSSDHSRSHNLQTYGNGSTYSDKNMTPIPDTNSTTEDSGDRNATRCNTNNFPSGGGATKFTPKSFTSFPASPQNNSSSANSEIVMNPGMVVPQLATDSNNRESVKKKPRWHFEDNALDVGEKLEVPDPNLLNWSSDGRHFGLSKGECSGTMEDPFFTANTIGDEKEFAFKDIGELDGKRLEEIFPALKPEIPGRYDSRASHPPAQRMNQNKAQLADGFFRAYNV